MPIIKSAIKRARQTATRREKNIEIKRAIRSAEKAFLAKPSAEALKKVQSEYDKAAKKGLMKQNTVSRRKAKAYKTAKAAGVKLVATKKPATEKPVAKKSAAKKAVAKKPTPKSSPKKRT